MTTDHIDQEQKEKNLEMALRDHLQAEADEVLKTDLQAEEEVVLTLQEEAATTEDLMIVQTNRDHFPQEV